MPQQYLPWLITGALFLAVHAGCTGAADPAEASMLPAKFRKLVPLHTTLGKPRPGDWLDQHDEPGQTFRQYVRGRPVKPDRVRRVIGIQPLGDFNRTQREILDKTSSLSATGKSLSRNSHLKWAEHPEISPVWVIYVLNLFLHLLIVPTTKGRVEIPWGDVAFPGANPVGYAPAAPHDEYQGHCWARRKTGVG